MDTVNVVDLKSVLEWLVAGGAPIVVMYALSLLAENWPKWHTLPKLVKFLVPMVASALLAIGAQAVTGYADIIVEQIAPWWKVVVISIMAYISSQQAYMTTKRSGYGTQNSMFTYEVIDDDFEDEQ